MIVEMYSEPLVPLKQELPIQDLNFSVITLGKDENGGALIIRGVDEGFKSIVGGVDKEQFMNKPLNTIFAQSSKEYCDNLLSTVGQKHLLEVQHLITKELILVEFSISQVRFFYVFILVSHTLPFCTFFSLHLAYLTENSCVFR